MGSKKQELLFAPVSQPQSNFLCSDAWLTFYGGAAFSGKSMCLLGSMLPIIHDPGTRAICIRKTTKQIAGSGGLFDAAINLYSKIDPGIKIKMRDLTIVFSSGAELQFTYLDKPADRLNLQGKEFSRILFDEGQQLDGENVFYALSRLRSTRVSYPLRAYVTLNPDPSSWIMPFVRHCLDENMIPIKKDKHPNRFFVRNSSGLHFYDTWEEANQCHPVDPNDAQAESPIKTYMFQPAVITDNPKGLEQNKDYISTLKALPLNEMRQLLYGAWTLASKSGYFKRDWISFASGYNTDTNRRVRAWDLAFSEPSEARPSVDATAGVLMSKEPKTSVYTVEDVVVIRKRVHDVENKIFETAQQDGKDVIISLPLDPGATAGAYCKDLARRLAEMGYTTKLVRPEKGKLQRFLPFASTAEAGFVKVVNSSWTEDYINELEQTEFNNKTHDDQCDATSDAFYVLNKYQALPDMTSSSFMADFASPTAGFSKTFNDLNPNSASYANSLPSYSFPSFSK